MVAESPDLEPNRASRVAEAVSALALSASVGPHRDLMRRRLLVSADFAAIVAVVLATGLAELGQPTVFAIAALGGGATAHLLGLYRRDQRVLRPLTADEIASLLAWALVTTSIVVLADRAVGASDPSFVATASFPLALVAVTAGLRTAARSAWRQAGPPERVVIIGHELLAEALRRKYELFADMHAEVVAVLEPSLLVSCADDREVVVRLASALPSPHLGVDRILVEFPTLTGDSFAAVRAACRRLGVKLGVVPPPGSVFGTGVRIDHVAELAIVHQAAEPVALRTLAAKRVLDVLLAALGLVITAPLLVVIAVAVKLDSRGPVFFRQVRAGQGGRPITILKFRTMVRDAEERLAGLVELDLLAHPMFKLTDDPRITRVGRLLRRTSLDELPQLLNVVRGDMSMVGVRPEQIELAERYSEEVRRIRLAGKPGLTGPMQVFGRGELTFEERLAVERDYVEHPSLRRDIQILLMTCGVVLRGRGAY